MTNANTPTGTSRDAPATAAGRELLRRLVDAPLLSISETRKGIIAIEAEAAAPTPAEPLDVLTTKDYVEWFDQLETFDSKEDDAYVLLSTTDRNILEQFRDAFAASLAAARPEAER